MLRGAKVPSDMSGGPTVRSLREMLRQRGLSTHGLKRELEERCRRSGIALSAGGGPQAASVPPPPPCPPCSADDRPRPSDHPLSAVADMPGDTQVSELAGDDVPVPSPAESVAGTPATQTQSGAADGSTTPARAGRQRAPSFTKHEKIRLGHVMCLGEVASGVVVSRGPMSRAQQDARTSRGAVWVALVAPVFNGEDVFTVPDECGDCGIDPNIHPHVRTGVTLQAKWAEVCFVLLALVLRLTCCWIFMCRAQHWRCWLKLCCFH